MKKKTINSFISVDPGLKGGLCLWNVATNLPRIQDLIDMPVMKAPTGKTVVDPDAVWAWISEAEADLLVQENVVMAGGKGKMAIISAGYNLGLFDGITSALNTPMVVVHPITWQSKMLPGLKERKAHKQAAALLVAESFPSIAYRLYGSRGAIKDGLADAIVIGMWYLGMSGVSGVKP